MAPERMPCPSPQPNASSDIRVTEAGQLNLENAVLPLRRESEAPDGTSKVPRRQSQPTGLFGLSPGVGVGSPFFAGLVESQLQHIHIR